MKIFGRQLAALLISFIFLLAIGCQGVIKAYVESLYYHAVNKSGFTLK